MKFILVLATILVAALACGPNEFPATIYKHFTSFSSEETVKVWQGPVDSVSLVNYKGVSGDADTDKSWSVCLSNTLYTIEYIDSWGDGWGSSSNPAYVLIQIGNVDVFKGGLIYQSGRTLLYGSDTFTPSAFIDLFSTWKYSDVAETGNSWTQLAFADQTWQTATSGQFPAFTAVTRYYRFTSTIANRDAFSALVLSLLVNHGVAVYVQGTEVYRYSLPAAAAATTPSTGTEETNTTPRTISFNKFILPATGSFVVAIEVHQSAISSSADAFLAGAFTTGSEALASCGYNYFRFGTTTSTVAAPSTLYAPAYIFSDNNNKYYYITTSNVVSFTYALPNHGSVWINQYTFRSASSSTYGYPKKWTVSGSNDGTTWSVLDQREGILFAATGETKTFPIRSNTNSFSFYKLDIQEGTVSGKIAVGLFQGFSCTYPQLQPGLQYEVNTITAYANIDVVRVEPSSSGYTTFTSSPALPAGLTLSPTSGLISGMCTVAVNNQQFVISAINGATGQSSSYTMTISMAACTSPNVQLRFRKVTKSYGVEEKYNVTKADGSLLVAEQIFANNAEKVDIVCVAPQVLTINVRDTYNDGWSSGAYLYVEFFLSAEDGYNVASRIFEKKIDTIRRYLIDASYNLAPLSSTWKYVQGQVPANWHAVAEPAGFSAFSMNPLPATTSNIWVFRNSFTVTNKANYVGFEMSIKYRAGIVVYVNNVEVYRDNLADGEITSATMATSSEATTSFKVISSSKSYINNGSNTIAIGIINLANNNPTTVLFDGFIRMLSANSDGRNWELTVSQLPTGGTTSNLIDGSLTTEWSNIQTERYSQTIDFNYGSNHREIINMYCIVSSNQIYAYDPSDWAVYGSQDGANFVLLANVTNAYFSDRIQQRCFYIPGNTKSYKIYRFLITENAVPVAEKYGYAMTELTPSLTDLEDINVPALSFSQTTYIGYVGVSFPEATPNDARYGNFRINPPLSLPLEIDTSTGSIRGTPNALMSRQVYRVTATDPKGNESSTDITLGVESCAYPNIMFVVTIKSATYGNELGFEFMNSNGQSLFAKQGFSNNQYSYFPFCQPYANYQIKITDKYTDGWGDGYFTITLEDDSLVLRGSLGSGENTKTFPVSLNYVIAPKRASWKYFNNRSAPASGWNTLGFSDTTWPSATSGNFGVAAGMTQYFRSTFTVDSASLYASVVFNIKTKYGVIVYINGVQVYYNNIILTNVNYNTPALSEFNEPKLVGSTSAFDFGSVVSGQNVIAIEVHRVETPLTPDIDFECNLLLTADNSYRILDGEGLTNIAGDGTISKLFDNIKGSVYISNGVCTNVIPEYTYNNNRREYISSYKMITGPTCNKRHPLSWRLEGSNDSGMNWSTLHIVSKNVLTSYSQELSFDFFNDKAFNSYRLITTECQEDAISGFTENAETCYPNSVAVFQLAEFGLYTKHLVASCKPADGYSGAVNHDYAYKSCAKYYAGRIQALCTDAVLGQPQAFCNVMAINSITYISPLLTVYKGNDFSFDLTVQGAEYQCFVDGVLPTGVNFDRTTGRIYGKTTELFENRVFEVRCTNTASPAGVSTKIAMNSQEKPGLAIWVWIVFGVIALIIILVLVLCIVNRSKSRKNRGHQNLDKKLSSKNKSASRKGSSVATDGTAKAIKV